MTRNEKNKAVAAYFNRKLQSSLKVTDSQIAEIEKEIKKPKGTCRIGRWTVDIESGKVIA